MKMTENHLYYEIWFYFKCVPIFRLKKSDLKCLIGLIKCCQITKMLWNFDGKCYCEPTLN